MNQKPQIHIPPTLFGLHRASSRNMAHPSQCPWSQPIEGTNPSSTDSPRTQNREQTRRINLQVLVRKTNKEFGTNSNKNKNGTFFRRLAQPLKSSRARLGPVFREDLRTIANRNHAVDDWGPLRFERNQKPYLDHGSFL